MHEGDADQMVGELPGTVRRACVNMWWTQDLPHERAKQAGIPC